MHVPPQPPGSGARGAEPAPDREPRPQAAPAAGGFGLGRRQVRLVLGFAAAAAATALAANVTRTTFLVPRQYPRDTQALYAYRTRSAPPDVLLLGTSRMDYALDAEAVGAELARATGRPREVYELIQRGMDPRLLHDVLVEFIRPAPPRELLVLEVMPEYALPSGPRTLEQVGSLRQLTDAHGEERFAAWRRRLLAPLRGLQVLWNLDWALHAEVRRAVAYQQEHGGQVSAARDAQLTAEEARLTRLLEIAGGPREATWSGGRGFDRHWLDRVFERLSELPCDVVLVRFQVHRLPPHGLGGTQRKAVLEVLRQESERRGFGLHDLNHGPFPRAPDDFRDRTHLGAEAAVRNSALFAREVLAPRLPAAAGPAPASPER